MQVALRWCLILRLSEKVVKKRCRTTLPGKKLNSKSFSHVCKGENKNCFFQHSVKSKESILMLSKPHVAE